MFQVRIHGRGGQGVVTAAELLSVAAFDEGRHAQAFPSFGSERTGAPVVAFCRIDDRADPRRASRSPTPDALIVQDPTLLHQVDVFGGLGPTATCWSTPRARSTSSGSASSCALPPERVVTRAGHASSPASTSAGRCRTPRCSAAFAALTGVVSLDVGRGRDPRALRRRASAERQRRGGRRRAYEHVATQTEAGRCLGRSRARGRSPRPSPLCRPEVIARLPDLAADPHRRGALATW